MMSVARRRVPPNSARGRVGSMERPMPFWQLPVSDHLIVAADAARAGRGQRMDDPMPSPPSTSSTTPVT